jgi:hypothetical protein
LAGDDEKSQRRKDDLDLECRELAIALLALRNGESVFRDFSATILIRK